MVVLHFFVRHAPTDEIRQVVMNISESLILSFSLRHHCAVQRSWPSLRNSEPEQYRSRTSGRERASHHGADIVPALECRFDRLTSSSLFVARVLPPLPRLRPLCVGPFAGQSASAAVSPKCWTNWDALSV